MDETAIRQLKVTELRAELSKLGLPTTGKKDELVARVLEALAGGHSSGGAVAATTSPSPAGAKSPLPLSDRETWTSARPPVQPHAVPTAGFPGDSSASAGKATAGTHEDRLAARAERFGLEPTQEARRKQRAERFGIGASAEQEGLFDVERMRARQARFGVVASGQLAKAEDEAAKLKRLERFGLQSK